MQKMDSLYAKHGFTKCENGFSNVGPEPVLQGQLWLRCFAPTFRLHHWAGNLFAVVGLPLVQHIHFQNNLAAPFLLQCFVVNFGFAEFRFLKAMTFANRPSGLAIGPAPHRVSRALRARNPGRVRKESGKSAPGQGPTSPQRVRPGVSKVRQESKT